MKIYTYKNCDSCRKATKWLRAQKIEFEEIPIRETPPSVAELKLMLGFLNGELKRLFNTSGQDYRSMGLKDSLPSMSESDALKLLSENGNLVKRPFLLTYVSGTVGFKDAEWASLCDG
ncbi:UNVERIFIED_CONTAM: hypothetical protein GTU68_067396 [Idotea baltica]|nr:hypothetical protein [Idotea baltica]